MTDAAGAADERPSERSAIVLLALLCVPLFFVATGTHDLDMKGEPREGITAWETIHGNWILPVLNGERLPEKPVMFPWLVALSMRVLGETSEWALRVPSALLATGLVLVTFGIGRRLLGLRAGTAAAAACACTFLTVSLARRARVDMALSFFVCFALLQFVAEFQRDEAEPASRPSPWRLAGFWLSMAFATLTKGPLGVILVVAPAGTFLLARRRLAFLRKLCPWWGVLTPIVVAGSWYAYGLAHRGGEFGFRAFLMENVLMFLGSDEGGGHRHGFFYLIPYYFSFGLPWSLLFPAAALLVVRRAWGSWSREPLLLPFLWFFVLLLFFSTASGKRSDYLLPLMPAAALVVAGALDAAPRLDDALARRVLAGSAWVLAVLGTLAAAAISAATWMPESALPAAFDRARQEESARALFEIVGAAPWATATVVAAALVGAWAPVLSLRRGRPERGIAVAAAAVAIAAAAGIAAYMPALSARDSLKRFTADMQRIAGPDADIRAYQTFEPQILLYFNRRIPSLDRPWPEGDDEESMKKRREIERGNRALLDEYLAASAQHFVLTIREVYDALDAPRKARMEIVLESHRSDRPLGDQSLLLRRASAR